MDLRANVYIDAYQGDELIAHREQHNVFCNTGRLFTIRRLVETIGVSSYSPINVFAVGDQGADPISDIPYEAEPTQTELNHEVIRSEFQSTDFATYPEDPNLTETPIYLRMTSSVNSVNVDEGLSYANKVSEACIASCPTSGTPLSDDSSYMVVYTTFSPIPFARTENVLFNITWNLYIARET